MSRRRRHFVKRAVDAITNFEFVFERLEMNVARPVLDRLIQNQIDEANDRRGVCFGFDSARAIAFAQLHQLADFAELLEDLLHAGGVAAVEDPDAVFDLFDRRDHDLDVASQREAQIFRGAQFQRIDQRHPQSVIDKIDRQRAMQTGQAGRNELHHLRDEFRRSFKSMNSARCLQRWCDKIRIHR